MILGRGRLAGDVALRPNWGRGAGLAGADQRAVRPQSGPNWGYVRRVAATISLNGVPKSDVVGACG